MVNSVEDGARRARDEAGRATAEQALREVIRSILPTLSPEEITGDKHLRDLGADSVDRVEIILGVTRRLGIDEPMSNFSAVPDIDGLVDHLSRGR
jgi:polyketide biosynthesis acyl carrier protein